jgi:hypothetical protein
MRLGPEIPDDDVENLDAASEYYDWPGAALEGETQEDFMNRKLTDVFINAVKTTIQARASLAAAAVATQSTSKISFPTKKPVGVDPSPMDTGVSP